MTSQPDNFFSQIQELCNYAGLKVVHALFKAPIHGTTRWLGDVPLIQLSGRYRRNDIFWFYIFRWTYFTSWKNIFPLKMLNMMEKIKNMKITNEFSANLLLTKRREENS
jgi:hypothetical protein